MQEQLWIYINGLDNNRITPAHAGTTLKLEKYQFFTKDHPCACRNNKVYISHRGMAEGSPLRMQEQLNSLCCCVYFIRITPAHAGTTKVTNLYSNRLKDHPCACRNNMMSTMCFNHEKGSPLRMQEQQAACTAIIDNKGITPAHAGTTEINIGIDFGGKDHPCACRNNFSNFFFFFLAIGSPLRMQEQHKKSFLSSSSEGITPAHAGTTFFF